jgi:cytochrome c biogenesis protein
MAWLWGLLNSRKTAVYLLVVFTCTLLLSTLLPSEITMTGEELARLRAERPFVFWLVENFSTPKVVRHPVFLVVSGFLFFSTLTCTTLRVRKWARLRGLEFEKEKAVSFHSEARSAEAPREVRDRLLEKLRGKGWECEAEGDVISAEKGLGLGFWGSVAFHSGLVVCFLAAPVTAVSVYRADIILTEGLVMPLRDALVGPGEPGRSDIADVTVSVHDLWGKYSEGVHKVDFGGVMNINGVDTPFSVNRAVTYRGYQIGLHEFGFSPKLVIERDGNEVFDYFLNLLNPQGGDYFPVQSGGMEEGPEKGMEVFLFFFPDFYREGDILKSRSNEPDNPVLLVKFIKDGEAMHRGLLMKPGEEDRFGDYGVRFAELRKWVGMNVVKEWGMPLIAAGFAIGISGLFVRFLSNERRLEFEFQGSGGDSVITVRGYSRYYPAFLEREVKMMAEGLVTGDVRG